MNVQVIVKVDGREVAEIQEDLSTREAWEFEPPAEPRTSTKTGTPSGKTSPSQHDHQ